MQLTEIKNDLATINYSPEINKLMLSDFILIEDANQSILAQIISIEATMEDDVNSAMLKFLLSIDKDANLTQYSGYVPAKSASLILINPQEVVQLIRGNDRNILMGNLALYPDVPIELSLDFMRKKPYIQVDFVENKLQIVKAIIKGLEKNNKKTVLIDFQGFYEGISLPTVTLGYNFKLPLNYEALCYIAEEELNDCSNENKAVIQGILIEVQNYVKSTPEEFIPFDTLISVLDAQYEESPMSELLLLKNKLLKYQQQGIFAQEKSEFDFLDDFLKDAKNFKFDLSELPPQWSKIAFISILNIIKAKCYLITDFTDENSNKTIIKKLYEKSEFKPIVISSYNYKYQIQLKAMSKNMVLFKPIQKINDFAGYTSFLNILSHDTFIVWGEQTLFIPLILKLQSDYRYEPKNRIEQTQKENQLIEEKIKDENIETSINMDEIENFEPIEEFIEAQIESEDIQTKEAIAEFSENLIMENLKDEVFTKEGTENIEQIVEENLTAEEIIMPEEIAIQENVQDITDNSIDEILPEIEETGFADITDSDTPTEDDMEFFFEENTEIEDINEIENISAAMEYTAENEETIQDLQDVIIDEALIDAPIDEQTAQEENKIEESDENIQQSIPKETSQNNNGIEIKSASIPVYTSTIDTQLNTKFAVGTYVHHPKHGRGVIEKVSNYGKKELYLIVFDQIGRKFVDPNIAELKQI